MATNIILRRKGSALNRRQEFKVLIDGKETASIKNDDTVEIPLDPGSHTIQCKINWMSSNEKVLELPDGKNVYLQVSTGLKYYWPLYILMIIGLLFPLLSRFSNQPLPGNADYIKIALIFPAILYYLFYITLYRKNYLVIEEDKSNPFAK